MFGNLWGESPPPPTAKELIKEQKKAVRKSQREIDREKRNLEKQEKKLLADIKRSAQKGDNGDLWFALSPCFSHHCSSTCVRLTLWMILSANAKQLAKQLVRTRGTMG